MKLYFTTKYTLKVKETTCIISQDTVQLQEINLAIPKDLITALETLPNDTELVVTISQATLYHDDQMRIVKRETE